MIILNKFDTRCNNPSCPEKRNKYKALSAGYGYAVKQNGTWRSYCPTCCPERIEAPIPIHRRITIDGEVYTAYEPSNLPLLRSFPGARWEPDKKCWSVSLSLADLPRTLEIANQLRLEIPEELQQVYKLTEQAQIVDSRLYPFQVKGVDHLSRRRRAFLGDQMGLGKTVQALAALSQDASWSVLVICPNSLKYNWRNEANKWAPKYTPVILEGKQGFRFPKVGEICISNYDILPADLESTKETPAKMQCPQGLTLIIDEAQMCKNWKAARSNKVKTLATGSERCWPLTGTPLANRPFDLWGVMCNTDCAREVFSFTKFLQLFNATKDRWGGYTFEKPGPELAERLRRVMLRRLREEVMPDLPKKMYSEIECNGLTPDLERRMDNLYEEWGDVLDADELPPFEQFSALRADLARSRIPAMIEQVDTYEEEEEPLVVFSAHRAPIDVLSGRAGWKVIMGDVPIKVRQEIVDEFQAGKLKGIGLTIGAGGTGITLTRASHMLFCDLDWVPSANSQAEDRICRIGQTAGSCHYIRLVSNHPLDKHVMRLLVSKAEMAWAAVDTRTQVVIPVSKNILAGETDEQYQIRLTVLAAQSLKGICDSAGIDMGNRRNELDAAVQKQEALTKIQRMAVKFRDKIGDWITQPMTPELENSIKGAFKMMVDNDPDYATELNGCGFSKPDSYLARWLGHNLNTPEELQSMFGLLYKYRKQLETRFPTLWPKR